MRDDSRVIFEVIRESMLPFKAQMITLEVEEGPRGRLLVVRVDLLPGRVFKQPIEDELISHYREFSAEALGWEIGKQIKNVQVPVDDHICLGQE